ncbi:MAG: methyltransferase domain-containing protein [Candidatus Micrarchaeia archaeon]
MVDEVFAWTNSIVPEDLDAHMASIGQVQANALITEKLFADYPLKPGSSLLVHACGTCQLFDFFDPSVLWSGLKVTLADVSLKLIDAAKKRLASLKLSFPIVRDDIENTSFQGDFNAVLLVLVLHHVNWKKSVENMIKLNPSVFYVIEQEQDGSSAVNLKRELPESIRKYAEEYAPAPIKRKEITSFFEEKGFKLQHTEEQQVPDNKKMIGLVFTKKTV